MITVKLKRADISLNEKLELVSALKKELEVRSSADCVHLIEEFKQGKTYKKYQEPAVIYRLPEYFDVVDDAVDIFEKTVDRNQEMLDILNQAIEQNDTELAMQFCRMYKDRPIVYAAMG